MLDVERLMNESNLPLAGQYAEGIESSPGIPELHSYWRQLQRSALERLSISASIMFNPGFRDNLIGRAEYLDRLLNLQLRWSKRLNVSGAEGIFYAINRAVIGLANGQVDVFRQYSGFVAGFCESRMTVYAPIPIGGSVGGPTEEIGLIFDRNNFGDP